MANSLDFQLKVWILFKFGFRTKSKIWDFLRRSKATHMLLNGTSLPVIQRFLGHESIQTTQAYLDTGSEAMLKAVAKAEEQLLASGIASPTVTDWRDQDILKRLKQLSSK